MWYDTQGALEKKRKMRNVSMNESINVFIAPPPNVGNNNEG